MSLLFSILAAAAFVAVLYYLSKDSDVGSLHRRRTSDAGDGGTESLGSSGYSSADCSDGGCD